MEKNKFLKYFLLYFGLIAGYLYLYEIDIERIVYPNHVKKTESKIDFVYQQF